MFNFNKPMIDYLLLIPSWTSCSQPEKSSTASIYQQEVFTNLQGYVISCFLNSPKKPSKTISNVYLVPRNMPKRIIEKNVPKLNA
jgi:hypothetical protein